MKRVLTSGNMMLRINGKYAAALERMRPGTDYAFDTHSDWMQIAPFLPDKCRSIIDIGCGLAGIDVYLKRKYPDAHLTLVDSDGTTPVFGYGVARNAYGDRALADELLAEHGVVADRWLPADTDERLDADLVISILAWGFHFPLHTYQVSGYCIADLRNRFEPQRGLVIHDNGKASRCAFVC